MAVVSRNGRSSMATQDDVLQASKAVSDRLSFLVKEQLAGIEEQLSGRLCRKLMVLLDKQLEGELGALCKHLRKELEEEYEGRLEVELTKRFESELARVLAESERKHLEMLEQAKAVYQDRLEIFVRDQKEHGERLEQVKALYQGRMDAFQQAHEEMLVDLRDLFKSMPQQPTPIVNVSVPEQNPTVNVHVPEQRAPVVNVQVPGQPAPVVNVQAPLPRLTSKSISYDEMGRPVKIEEKA